MSERLFDSSPDDLFGGEPLTQEQRDREFLSSPAFAGMTQADMRKFFANVSSLKADLPHFGKKDDISQDSSNEYRFWVTSIKVGIYQIFTNFYANYVFPKIEPPNKIIEPSPDFTWEQIWNMINSSVSCPQSCRNQKKTIFLDVAQQLERDYYHAFEPKEQKPKIESPE